MRTLWTTMGLLLSLNVTCAQSYRCIFLEFAPTGEILNEIRFHHTLHNESIYALESKNFQINLESLLDALYFEVIRSYERSEIFIESSHSDNRNKPDHFTISIEGEDFGLIAECQCYSSLND